MEKDCTTCKHYKKHVVTEQFYFSDFGGHTGSDTRMRHLCSNIQVVRFTEKVVEFSGGRRYVECELARSEIPTYSMKKIKYPPCGPQALLWQGENKPLDSQMEIVYNTNLN